MGGMQSASPTLTWLLLLLCEAGGAHMGCTDTLPSGPSGMNLLVPPPLPTGASPALHDSALPWASHGLQSQPLLWPPSCIPSWSALDSRPHRLLAGLSRHRGDGKKPHLLLDLGRGLPNTAPPAKILLGPQIPSLALRL